MDTFFIFNTGCIRRGLDTIKIYDYLIANKWHFTRDVSSADIIVLTTCGAVQEKEQGSLSALKKVLKEKSEASKIIITGCLSKINPAAIRKYGDFQFIPTGEYDDFDKVLNSSIRFRNIPEANTITDDTGILDYVLAYRLFRNSPALMPAFNKFCMNRAFLRFSILVSGAIIQLKGILRNTTPRRLVPYYSISIAEGCLGNCAFCAIKFATGSLRSKPVQQVLREFKEGLQKGYKYIQLVSEDTGCYGDDIGTTFPALLRKILSIKGDYRLIIIDLNPRWLIKFYDQLLPLFMQHQEKIRELFIPIQSGSDRILKSMNRSYDISELKHKLLDLNRKVPGIRLRTTFIVGFPGENEQDLNESKQIINDVDFYEVTLNKYEDRPNTESSKLKDKIPQSIINKRTKELSRYC